MNPQKTAAFALRELVSVLASVFVLAALIVSANQFSRKQALEGGCVFNLRQLGIAAFSWSADHTNAFPWRVPPIVPGIFPEDGSGGMPNAWQHFWVMRKEIDDPRRVWCPADDKRMAADRWGRETPNGLASSAKQNSAVSYFIGMHASNPSGNNPIFGDRNIEGGAQSTICAFLPGLPVATQLNSRPDLRWGTNIHGGNSGNLVLSDGSVLQSSDQTLRETVEKAEAREGNRNFHVLPPL